MFRPGKPEARVRWVCRRTSLAALAAISMVALIGCVSPGADSGAAASGRASLGEQKPWSGIGRAATPAEIAAWDIDVRADFKGLPKGSGSVDQGMEVWDAKCASCHGTFGESNEVFSPLVGAELRVAEPTQTALPLRRDFEHGLQVLTGRLTVDGEVLEPGTLLVLEAGRDIVSMTAEAGTCAVLIGGAPMPEEILMWWNFVGRDRTELAIACSDWNTEAPVFGKVQGYDGERLVAPMPPW